MSLSLDLWQGAAQEVFAELELAHRAVHGRAQRFLTQQITYAYVTALAAQFQLYCRAVHTEVAQAIARSITNPAVASVVEGRLIEGRRLNRGNANVPNLGSDFQRFELRLWDELMACDKTNLRRKESLEALIQWRNAIGHGDIAHQRAENTLTPGEISLEMCREWNVSLTRLIVSIDDLLAAHLETLGLGRLW